MINKYRGECKQCGGDVPVRAGNIEKTGNKWVLWCASCYFDHLDHSSQEDRCCGDMAYEDECARQCGF